MENTGFLVARRRNEQNRNGASWITELEQRIGLDAHAMRILEADTSVRRERERLDLIKSGLLAGSVSRTSGLSLETALSAWDAATINCCDEDVVCELLHHPDFPIVVRAGRLQGKLQALIEYDGDTIGLSTLDLRKGIFVDMYSEHGSMVFEVDRWGEW